MGQRPVQATRLDSQVQSWGHVGVAIVRRRWGESASADIVARISSGRTRQGGNLTSVAHRCGRGIHTDTNRGQAFSTATGDLIHDMQNQTVSIFMNNTRARAAANTTAECKYGARMSRLRVVPVLLVVLVSELSGQRQNFPVGLWALIVTTTVGAPQRLP
jgi:hypothetical protein